MESNSRELRRDTDLLLLRRALRRASVAQMAAWATTALLAGWDSPTLRVLAGLDLGTPPSGWEAEPFLDRTLVELGISPRDSLEAASAWIDRVAEDIVRSDVSPRAAIELIHAEAVGPLEHPAALQGWCDLTSGFDPLTGDYWGESVPEELIRGYASWWTQSRASAA